MRSLIGQVEVMIDICVQVSVVRLAVNDVMIFY